MWKMETEGLEIELQPMWRCVVSLLAFQKGSEDRGDCHLSLGPCFYRGRFALWSALACITWRWLQHQWQTSQWGWAAVSVWTTETGAFPWQALLLLLHLPALGESVSPQAGTWGAISSWVTRLELTEDSRSKKKHKQHVKQNNWFPTSCIRRCSLEILYWKLWLLSEVRGVILPDLVKDRRSSKLY